MNSEGQEMHRLSIATIAGMLALTTSGSDSSLTITQFSPTVLSPKKPSEATSKKPITLGQNQKPGYPEGLIRVTSGVERLKQLQFGRSDPFTVALPTSQLEVTPKPKKVFPDLPKLPLIEELPLAPLKAPSEVTRPNTDLAKGVAVEGVVQIGDKSHAIVKLPTDLTSRYVSVGQELLGGRLLVKRIEIPIDSEPVVVLEQNGIEVSLALGGETAGDTGAIASSTLGSISSDYGSSNSVASDKVTGTEISSSVSSDKEVTGTRAAKPVLLAQAEEYTTERVPIPQSSSLPQKQPLDIAVVTQEGNKTSSTGIATSSVSENYLSSQQKDSTYWVKRSSVGEFQQQPKLEGVAFDDIASSFDVSSHPKDVTASADEENDVRQRLIERLRSGSNSLVDSRLESDSPQTASANIEDISLNPQLLRERLGGIKRGVTQGELSTSGSNIEVLAHRQRLINQLRGGGRVTNN
jgi:hypothetical protein